MAVTSWEIDDLRCKERLLKMCPAPKVRRGISLELTFGETPHGLSTWGTPSSHPCIDGFSIITLYIYIVNHPAIGGTSI